MPDLQLTVEFADGELRETHHAHWATAGLPRKPIDLLRVRQNHNSWEVSGHSEFACWHPVGVFHDNPVLVFSVDLDRGQVRGTRWRFYAGRDPEVDVIDETIGSPRLPPPELFIPGASLARHRTADRLRGMIRRAVTALTGR